MTIESELLAFLTERIPDGSEVKIRDTKLIHYYYGFQEDIEPTLEESAITYGAGTRENARLILNGRFRTVVNPSKDLPSTVKCAEIIASHHIISSSRLSEEMRRLGLSDSEANIMGILRLLDELKIISSHSLYTPELAEATKFNYHPGDNSFLMKNDLLPEVREDFRRAKTLAGQCGFASLASLKDEIGKDSKFLSILVEILKANNNFWSCDFEEETYYLFETLGKTLFNHMQKVQYVSPTVELKQLAKTLHQSFRKDKPPLAVIEKYLGEQTKFTTPDGKNVKLNFEQYEELTQMEEAVVELLLETPFMTYPSLVSKLREKRFDTSEANIDKNIFQSPLVYKSGELKSYRYALIGESSENKNTRRAVFEQWLEEFKDETDREQLILARREQAVLRKWLFEGKDKENCAVCDGEYSVNLLRAAHKKKRSDCTNDERRDFNIVMPLCLFGCDAMYEERYLIVRGGKVTQGASTENLTEKEKSFIDDVVGRDIDARWLEGEESYFD